MFKETDGFHKKRTYWQFSVDKDLSWEIAIHPDGSFSADLCDGFSPPLNRITGTLNELEVLQKVVSFLKQELEKIDGE